MGDFLTEMRQSSQRRVDRLYTTQRQDLYAHRAATTQRVLSTPFSRGIIAEIKPTSPAEGSFQQTFSVDDAVQRALAYERGGAVALSILTEPERFHGDLDVLRAVANAVSIPVMRKDFLIDPIQLNESALAGANGVLLIARMMPFAQLETMLLRAADLNLFVLLEAFDSADIAIINRLFPHFPNLYVGINSRDLTTLKIRKEAFAGLVNALPNTTRLVAESGLNHPEDVARVRELGFPLQLVGSAFMRHPDPETMVTNFHRTSLQGVGE